MAVIIKTADLVQSEVQNWSTQRAYWLYCGLDAAVAGEVFPALEPFLTPIEQKIERFEFGMNIIGIALSQRGVLVDEFERVKLAHTLMLRYVDLQEWLGWLADAIWGQPLNHRSSAQLQAILYDTMKLPVQYKRHGKERKVSTDRESLEKLEEHFYAAPLIKTILALKDIEKQLQVLRSGTESNGRMYTSFNAKVADTGRWTSSKSHYGRGTNMQNISREMRGIFIADPGCMFANGDLEQAESRVVAYSSRDEAYIAACESGDLHTYVARLVWPQLPWVGDLEKDKEIAERPFYRWFTFRDMAKRGGHGTNYLGTPKTMAMFLKIEQKVMEEFQERYFATFPGIPEWHRSIYNQLHQHGYVDSPLLRRRVHFGRVNDPATLRQAVASVPQGTICDILDVGMLRVWKQLELEGAPVRMLLQGHDACLALVPETDALYWGQEIQRCLTVPVQIYGRRMIVPVEMKYGYNWRDMVKPAKVRELRRPEPGVLLDRLLSLPMAAV